MLTDEERIKRQQEANKKWREKNPEKVREYNHRQYLKRKAQKETVKKARKKPIKVKIDPGAFAPVRAHPTDAGLDLRTPFAVKVPAHGAVIIDTGVHIELPPGTYGKLESKSGLNVNHCVVSLGGTIDEPYRGSIVAKLYNLSDRDYWFSEGDKVVQLIIMPYLAPDIEIVDELTETDRGDNGFGSSGK